MAVSAFESCRIEIAPVRVLATAEDVRAWLLGGEAHLEGWLCCTGEVRAWSSSEGVLPEGVPLSAELVATNTVSYHLRRGDAGWRVWHFREHSSGDQRADRIDYVSTEAGRKLCYRRYWHQVTEHHVQVWRPFAARFVGWSHR